MKEQYAPERQGTTNTQRAKQLMVFYTKTLWMQAGLPWTEKNQEQIEEVVDLIIAAGAHTAIMKVEESNRNKKEKLNQF